MIQLGTWRRSKRDAASLPDQLERAVAAAAMLTVGGGGGVLSARGLRAPSIIKPERIMEIVGSRFAVRKASHLVAITSQGRKDFEPCRHNGKTVKFDFWFPHFGIAIDVTDPEGGVDEIQTKIKWCQDGRRILYFPPGTHEEIIRSQAAQRRERMAA